MYLLRGKASIYVILALVVAVFSMSYWLASLYTDWLWFGTLNYQSVFLTVLLTEMGLRVAIGLLFFAFILFNLLFTRRFLLEKVENFQHLRRQHLDENVIVIQQPPIEEWLGLINKRTVFLFFIIISAVLAFMTSSAFSGDWITVQKFLNATDFGKTDPIFNKDIGFYVFLLPLYQFILSFLTWTTIVTALVVAVIYFLSESMLNNGRIELIKSTQARIHLSALAALYFVFKAIDFFLSRYMLLFSETGVIYGAGYTDINVNLLALTVLAVLSVLTALVILVNIRLRRFNLVMYSVVGLIVTAIILTGVVPSLVERFVVVPNQFHREEPYIAHNIEFTRAAYNLDKIEVASFPAGKLLNADDISNNRATVDNIRLWDWKPLMQTYAQLQELRLYYEFVDNDIDRYMIDGEIRQVMLSAREMNIDKLPAQAKTWVNQHLMYTHGFGVAMSPVNEVTTEGLPEFFIKDIPPVGIDDVPIERPEVYFGEKTDQYVFVNTKTQEFNYPMGDQNVYTNWEGDTGIKINSFFRKLVLAYVLSDYRMIFTGDITPESQLLMDRNIKVRVPKIAPFLKFDDDPYIVISEGKLYWLWDAYTSTNMYPYSEPYQENLNYLRNSVKAVVDAYTGLVDFYIADPDDPIIQVYSKIFPDMFKDLDEMPEDLRRHIRYPIDLFAVQASMYTTYHMTNAQVFYNKEDRWQLPTEVFAGDESRMEPYYTVIELPDSDGPEFVQILPFTPTNRVNMIGWLAGRSDGDNYGRLLVYTFPQGELVYGPMQIEARIDQDGDISQQLTLWSQRGVSVIRGNLLVIPINNAIIYVEPLYLKAEQSSMPELRRVIVAHGDRIVMEPTLELALQRLFGEGIGSPIDKPTLPSDGEAGDLPGDIERPSVISIDQLIQEAERHFNEGQQRLKEGDWAGYGESQNKLREVLERLSEQTI
ncbi:UPF0182 family protein [Desulfofalx alkaliphila]|uniref:UPF0182 family membrane protein n=1 Tax=Desulfofalx alkaliphila TaxID=105483 RepID=UPI00308283C8